MQKPKENLDSTEQELQVKDTIQRPLQVDPKKEKRKKLLEKLPSIFKLKRNRSNTHRSTSTISSSATLMNEVYQQAIHYKKSVDTTKYNKDYNLFQQTDQKFYQSVKYICEKNKNLFGNILTLTEIHKNQLTDEQCDKIDYIARKHYKANMISEALRSQHDQNKKESDKCPCGCDKYRGKHIPFWTSINQLKFLGSGVLLIFMFVKIYAILMALSLVIYGVFALVTNLIGGQNPSSLTCTDEWCRFVNNSANSNKIEPHPLMKVQWWLGLGFSVVWLIATNVAKFNGRQMNIEIDKKLKSASDRAVFVRNLPQGDFTESELLEYFQRLWLKMNRERERLGYKQNISKNSEKKQQWEDEENGNNFHIQRIQIIYSMQFARKIIAKIVQNCHQIDSMVHLQPYRTNSEKQSKKKHKLLEDRSEYHKIKKQLIRLHEILKDLRNKFLYEQNFRRSLSGVLAIVEFRSQKDKNELLRQYGQQKIGLLRQIQEDVKNWVLGKAEGSLRFKGKFLNIERAPQPSDIQWINCELPYSTRKTLGLYGLTILIICVSLGMVLALDRLTEFVNSQAESDYFVHHSVILSVIGIATALILKLVNFFLWQSIAYMIESEVNYTVSERIISHMNKALFAQSVNIILLPLITNCILKVDVFSKSGLISMVFDYQFSTLVFDMPQKLFNPKLLLKRIALYIRFSRNWIIRRFCLQINMKQENQGKGIKTINHFYEGQQFEIAQYYVDIIVTIYHAVFFCQIQPAVLIFGTLNVIALFFILKVKLFYFCNAPGILDLNIFETAVRQVYLVPIIYGSGAITLSYIENQIYPDRPVQYYQAIISMGLAFFFFFNPCDLFNKIVNLLIDIYKKIKIDSETADQKIAKNNDTYYDNSNSLELLGFETYVKSSSLNPSISQELKQFCSQFLPKSKQKLKEKYYQSKDHEK